MLLNLNNMSKNVSIVSYLPENRIVLMRRLRTLFPDKTLPEIKHIVDNCLPYVIDDLSNADVDYILERLEEHANCIVTDNDDDIFLVRHTPEYNNSLEEARKWRDSLSETNRKHFDLLLSQNVCYAVA